MNLGFIGTGALTSAIVTGLRATPAVPCSILLSPRNEQVASGLATRFPEVRVAHDNQAVLDESDVVLLALRPPTALVVVPGLRFHPSHHVISLIAPLPLGRIAELVRPAGKVTKAVPVPPVANREGATLIYPPDSATSALFARLGEVLEVSKEAELVALTTATATFAGYFQYLATIQAWLETQGVSPATARRYVAALFSGLAGASNRAPSTSFGDLAGDYATKGGINEQLLEHLTARGLFDGLQGGLDAVQRRITHG